MSGLVGRAIGGVANGVISKVDVDEVVQRISMNEVLDKVDWNELFEKVDIDRILDRIDMDKLVDRIPVQKIVDKSNMKEIIARSSSGIFSNLLDVIRAQAIRVDQVIQGCSRCQCSWREHGYLPPDPRNNGQERDRPCPKKASSLAMAVQGRSAGQFSRFLSWLVDECLLALVFALAVVLTNYVIKIFAPEFSVDANKFVVPFIYFGFSTCYNAFMLAVIGKTIGKVIMGLLVVEANGKRLAPRQAFPRALIAATSVLVIIFCLLGLFRRDRRGLHDLMLCTTVVYAWDAERFQMREENMTDVERLEPIYATVIESKKMDRTMELDP